MAVAKQRPDAERLPREGYLAGVVDRPALEVSPRHLPLGVLNEHLALAGVEQAAGVGLLPHPRHDLVQQLAQGRHAFLGLFAQPLADLGWIGELAHAEDLARQQIVVECLEVGEAAAAQAQRVEQRADDHLWWAAPPLVLARVEAEGLAQLVSEAEAAAQGLDGDQAGVDGMIGVGDKCEFESDVFLGAGSHMFL